ncbi:hypothetical protein [Trueperella pyogenes]|uniref:hypothetical protein n=1 Tax=Trueperella pyogenes TaxID=1661 RepID=UPI0032438AC5
MGKTYVDTSEGGNQLIFITDSLPNITNVSQWGEWKVAFSLKDLQRRCHYF